MSKILITGGAGFIGSNVFGFFLEEGFDMRAACFKGLEMYS